MEVVPLHDQGEDRHAGFGAQPTQCQIQSPQRALSAAFVRAVSIDSAEARQGALKKLFET